MNSWAVLEKWPLSTSTATTSTHQVLLGYPKGRGDEIKPEQQTPKRR